LLGLSHEEALGHGWLEAIHVGDRARIGNALDGHHNADDALELECRIIDPAGREHPARIRAVPVRGDNGALTGYLASLEDRTEEQAASQAVARLSELADVLDEWIVVVDPDLNLRYANPAARRGLGIAPGADLHQIRIDDFVVEEQRDALTTAVITALDAGAVWSGPAQLAARDGRRVELDATIAGHPDTSGAVAHYSLLGRDVTTMRTMQRALDESEERFRLIADSSPTGIYFVAEGGVISYANPRLAEILGEPVTRLVGRSMLEWVHPEDVARIVESGEIVAGQLRDTNVELRVRRSSGEVRWLRAQGAPVVDSDDNVHGYVGSLVDITDERVIARGLAMLERAVESTPDMITFHDRDGHMFFANVAARDFFGIGANGSVPSLGPTEYLDAAPEALVELERALATNAMWSGELMAVNETGRRMPVDVSVVGHHDSNGEIEYYSAVSRDLTERKRAEMARQRSETMLRAIVQSSPLAIFAIDREGVVHVWNHAAADVFGWTAADVVGSKLPFVDDTTEAEVDDLIRRVFDGRTVKGYRARYVCRDGSSVDVDLSMAPLRNPSGRVVSAVAVLADVTEQTRAAEAVHESEVWFRSLVQHSTDMVIVMDGDGAISYMSPSACTFAGVHLHDVMGMRVNEVFHAVDDDLLHLQELFMRLRATPELTERATFSLPRGDGELRRIEMAACNLIDDPAVRGIVVNCRDITESYEAHAAVRASEERLRALVSSVSDAICVVADDGSLLYSSPVADAMFDDPGSDDTESVFGSIDPDDLPRALTLWEQTRSRPGVFEPSHVRILRRDGSSIDAEVIANNLLDDPSVRGIVMTIRDITERTRAEQALRESDARLRESEARYRAVVDDQIELVCRYRADTTITFVNQAFADFYGRTRHDLIGSLLTELRPLQARDDVVRRVHSFSAENDLQTYEDWELGVDGARRCYRWTDRSFLDERGAIVEIQSVGHDVTDERRAAILTANQADILEQVARGVPLDDTLNAIASTVEQHFSRLSCAVYLPDGDGALRLAASPTVTRDASAGLSLDPAWTTPILAADGRTTLGCVVAYPRDDSEPTDEQRGIFSLVAHLASIAIERKAFEHRLAHESMHDPLTGLPNRLLFIDRLSLSLARGRRTESQTGVLFLDLDRFKNINDSLGHDAGDELLQSVAARLESVVRPGDTVARFGGDEFTILCEDLANERARDRAAEIAQRVVTAMAQPFVVRGAETYIGVSVGIALSGSGEETADALLRDADAAMYHAKDAGRGRIEVFDDAMRARAMARHTTENALHRAIERDELRVFFQPIVRLVDARCIGAEALVRWQHPERGLVPPSEFVPLAEESGLVVPLGAWVLEQAAAHAARWQIEQPEFCVSVNLSARQLAQADLAEHVTDVIARTGVAPSSLCFEITETALMNDADAVMNLIDDLRALGVRFAIDDFGTGYSSLGYLKRFSVDTVKIDRAFVDGLADDADDRAIVSAVIQLSHALGLRVVAEGVETETQLTELVALGCDDAQGYFFAPPQPANDLRALVSATRRWRPPGTPLLGRG
jgi:diguanylate cyclase (GGDEF)-like protein/PAS domain S-box-containing protein